MMEGEDSVEITRLSALRGARRLAPAPKAQVFANKRAEGLFSRRLIQVAIHLLKLDLGHLALQRGFVFVLW